jgi:ABC-type antimicrobial peptide transport system permease subunit
MQGIIENPMVQLITPLGEDSVGVFRGASYVIVRSAPGQVAAVRTLVRRELESEFPTRAAYFVKSVDETMATELRPWRVGLLLFGGFGALALVIATLGTYSVLSYNVTQRLHEMGVRIALGARATDVMRLVVGQGLRLAMTGVVAGVVVSLLASRVLRSLLYETSTGEPMVMVAVAAVLVAIAGLASAVPARRAARVDPVKVMRAE